MIKTIVIGAGVMGASVAYRLAQAGCGDGAGSNARSDWRFRRIKAITQQYVAVISSIEAPATLEDDSPNSPGGAPAKALPAAPSSRYRAADNSR